jgi:hypothetical protein
MHIRRTLTTWFCLVCLPLIAHADNAAPLSALARMPVKEITVFKDGNVFVLHEGKMPTDADGAVKMDYLPTPILGTFWPYSADKSVHLAAVTASQRRVSVERTALTLRDLLESNPGAVVSVTQTDGKAYSAEIVGVPQRSSQELERTAPPNSGDLLPQKSGIILLKTPDGTAVVNLDAIKDATFKNAFRRTQSDEEFRNLLTLKLQWPNGRPEKTASVGMIYVQRGIRWIPSYKVTIDGKGSAHVQLQATLVNELTDLDDVTANLVIGVPSFAFQDTPDPISIQQTIAQLSASFDASSRTANGFSNAIMGQVGGGGGFGGGRGGMPGMPGPAGPQGEAMPAVSGSTASEDLYVFTVKHISLKKGERMVLPISEYDLPYHDIYTVDLPFAPPRILRPNVNSDQQAEMERLINEPHAVHKLRITDKSNQPLTTAPALIISGERVIAQGMMTYTAPGSETDLTLTTDPNIKIRRKETERKRTPYAEIWQGIHYAKIDLTGTLTVTNYGQKSAEIDVTHDLFGVIDSADHDGKREMQSLLGAEDSGVRFPYPYWWNWYSWPDWWLHLNGLGRITWKVTLAPGQSTDLGYAWHYLAP